MVDIIEVTDNALWKFFDDKMIAERVLKNELSTSQSAVSEIATKFQTEQVAVKRSEMQRAEDFIHQEKTRFCTNCRCQ